MKHNQPVEGHIASRLIVTVIVFSTFIALLTTAYQLYEEYQRDIGSIELRLENIRTGYLESIAEAVWVVNHAQMKMFADGIYALPDIVYVAVKTNSGMAVTNGEINKEDSIKYRAAINYNFDGRDYYIGELDVQATLAGVYARLQDRVWIILVVNGFKTFMVALFLYVLLDRLIIRHIVTMADHIRNNSFSDRAKPLQLDRLTYGGKVVDELETLVSVFNDMQLSHTNMLYDLRHSEARLEAIYQSIPDAIIFTDSEQRIQFINAAARFKFGYQPTELIGKDIQVVCASENADKRRFFQEKSQKTQQPFEMMYQCKDGTIFYGETSGMAVRDRKAVLHGFVAVIRDITERKHEQEELLSHREHLQELVQDRTKELSTMHSELIRKERLATLGQLTATVSHELRNPLSVMKPSLFVIQKKSDVSDTVLQQAIERLDRNIERCDHIIDELLDFTRITDLKKEATKLDSWLQQLVDELHIPPEIECRGLYNLNDANIDIDPNRFRRVVINVLENAHHAMINEYDQKIQAGARITLTTRRTGDRVEIIVSDNGAGIPDHVLPNIFEPLYSTKGFGVGLGMSTVKQIMEQHGGGVELNTSVRKGTSVTLWLPAVENTVVAA